MPAQSTQTISDGTVNHVFGVAGSFSEGGEIVAKWINRAASSLTGGAEWLYTYFRNKKDGAISFRYTIIMPITESVGGVDVVTRTLRSTTTFELPANSGGGEREKLYQLVKNGLDQTMVANVIGNGEPVY